MAVSARRCEWRWRRVRCAEIIVVVLCIEALLLLSCNGQKPINLGGIKRRDVYIAGFFPYGRHVPESHVGRGVMPSVKLAVDHINENPTILRNYRLHMWWNDTECNAAVGVKAFFDMMHSGPHKVMLFGAACTQVTDPIAKASKHWRLTQLSYADTHPMFTQDSFPNFFRVVPSENAFNAPRVALLQHFNWTRVGTIYQNEPRYALAHNRLVADLDANRMEVVETQSFATEVSSALAKLKEKDVRIILGNFDEVWARRIFCEAHKFGMYGRKYQWVIMGTYAEEWWLRPGGGCAPSELAEALHAAILTDLLPLSTEQQITVSGITPDEYRVEYDLRRGAEYSRFHGYTYDGIWAVALAIQHVARRIRHFRRNQTVADFKYRDQLWEMLFLDALKNTSFEGVTGPVRFYGNERKAYILMKQFQSGVVPGGSEVKVGEYNGVTGELDLTRGQPLEWRGKSPPKDRTLHIIEHSMVNTTIYAVLAAAASVGIVMAAIFLAINIRYRNQRYIKMSSPHLNNLIIIGCMLTYSSVIFLGLDSQLSSVTAFPIICTTRAWLLMAGFSLAFGSMFSKTWRVHSIFTDVKLNKKVIKDYQLFIVVGVLLILDLAIMTTWQIADPFYRETKQMEPYPHPSSEDIIIIPENEYCQSNRMTIYLCSIYVYKGLLLIFGAFLAWETRHVSIPALNDSKYVGMSVYNVVIMCVTGAAISFVLADKQDAMFIILAVFIIFCSTTTLCLVFVPKLIELRRNPQGSSDKKFRPTLRPTSKTRRDSSVTELEERLKEAKSTNQKFRKQLLDKESELQMFVRRLGNNGVPDTQEVMDRLTVPRPESIIKKEELTVQGHGANDYKGPSIATETTDISMSMCSLNSTTVSQPEGEYANLPGGDTNSARKKTSFSKLPTIAIDSERIPLVSSTTSATVLHSAMKQPSDSTLRRKTRLSECRESEPLLQESQDPKPEAGVEFVPEVADEGERVILEETDIPRNGRPPRIKEIIEESRPRLPTPPPASKNVSFGEPQEQNYLEQAILPPPSQFVPKQTRPTEEFFRSGSVTASSHQSSLRRRASVKNNGIGHHHELFEKRRTSVPANSISYISTENIRCADVRTIEESLEGQFNKAYIIGECGHLRPIGGAAGLRCERHGGRGHSHAVLNGGALDTPTPRRHRKLCDSHNASSPNVPTTVNASSSDTEKYEESLSNIIQRSVSEKSREKCVRARGLPNSGIGECPHRGPRRLRECQHSESKLRQQAKMDYVQSTPNVATIHNNKFASGNRGSTVNVSKMYSAVSAGELLDVAILPIFQKLLSERHKNTTRGGYGASCPNISIKCDIVEYL
ncbi:gamma-aminobutyric acid type B receptor subunit 2 isoform X1 [Neodiprion fabricii]|uniref:gamma-aminobutyric acid type B receptor subunit 2 isoform X1 n=1 Tax=Neodiprion fabricii TaxID=2872261 RepID=UPI001ED97F96|nr:gamma-aminobutyric acid type B receptor subunit 2 isoform X1 [Neodiprion fabricii]